MWHIHSFCLHPHLSLNLLFALAFASMLVIVVPSMWIKKPVYPSNSLMATVTSSLSLLLPWKVSPRELFTVSLHCLYSPLFSLMGCLNVTHGYPWLWCLCHHCFYLLYVWLKCLYVYWLAAVVVRCWPVTKQVCMIIHFFKGLYWLFCWPRMPLIFISISFKTPFYCQAVCYSLVISHMLYS